MKSVMVWMLGMTSALLAFSGAVFGSELAIYNYPRTVKYHPGDTVRDPNRNTEFVVRVRTLPGGAWQPLYEHRVEVDWNEPQSATLVRFDFEGRVEVAIQRRYGELLPSCRAPHGRWNKAPHRVRYDLSRARSTGQPVG